MHIIRLTNAETEEELQELAKNGGAVMGEAINAYRGITATDEFKSLEWIRAKTRRDESNALSHARKQERKHWQGVVADKDATIADKDATIADNNATIANNNAAIAELRTQLIELQALIKK